MAAPRWAAAQLRGQLRATCPVPGSKSESNRALVLAALADGPSKLSGLLAARDTELMIAGLRQLGVEIEVDAEQAQINPPAQFSPVPAGIDCGLAGTVMRFLPALAALAPGTTKFFGDPHASQRPLAPLLDGLAQLGVQVDADRLPLTLSAPAQLGGPAVEIDSSASSQFISALLLAAARYPSGLRLSHVGSSVPSLPHIEMTEQMLTARGVSVEREAMTWTVQPGKIAALDQIIEPDLTNAAAFLAAGVVSGGSVRVPAWPTHSVQPGNLIRDVLEQMGAHPELSEDRLLVSAGEHLAGVDIDLHAASELTPVVAGLAVFAEGVTTIRGVAHIRGHETDRLAAIAAELAALGVAVTETADGLRIMGRGLDPKLEPTRDFKTYADHRMAHLGALLGLRTPGLILDDVTVVTKTMPDFVARWTRMLEQR